MIYSASEAVFQLDLPKTPRILEEGYAAGVVEQAGHWARLAKKATRMKQATIQQKAADSVLYTLNHSASNLAIPSKVQGASRVQDVLRGIHEEGHQGLTRLEAFMQGPTDAQRIALYYRSQLVGYVQSKHQEWVRSLLPFGLHICISRITGTEREEGYLGCNIVFTNVGEAWQRGRAYYDARRAEQAAEAVAA